MKNYLIILIFIICSCKNFDESKLILNVDPLTEAYKRNNIDYYLKTITGKDTIYSKDSTSINKSGLITLKKTLHGFANNTSYSYDEFNRIIQTEHQSDIYYKFKTVYIFNESSNSFIANNYSYNLGRKSFSKKPTSITYFKFQNSKLIEEVLTDAESKDTMTITSYKYNSYNKISLVSKNNLIDRYKLLTHYRYRSNNTLSEIFDEKEKEVKYISQKTGLIDSVKDNRGEKTYYKYHSRRK